MKHVMIIEYLKCSTDLNFEVDFRVKGAIGTTATKYGDRTGIFHLEKRSFLSVIYLFFPNLTTMPLTTSYKCKIIL